MGPAYSDKAARRRTNGRPAGALRTRSFDPGAARAGAARLADLHCSDSVAPEEVVARAARWADVLRSRICDVERHLRSAVARGASVLLEGAQGALLDIDAGSYPFVTSSSTGVAGACASAGIPPRAVDSVVAVLHSYMTRVGAGPFPTELHDEVGRIIQDRGAEFGTTTGRRRRCGWFDALASRYVMEVNGVTSAVLTKLDVLDGLETVKVCVAYELDGKRIEHMPASATVIAKVSPVYEEMPGWPEGSMQARRWEDLHPRAQEYVRRIEELLGVPVSLLSVGPARDQTIQLRDPLAAN
ncbi:MAG: adenylosuccinate synthetase [Chloroflexia bacterium]